jgi:Integrase zinc binding domain/Integrase core domain
MELQHYYQLRNYLQHNKFPNEFNQTQQKQLQSQSKFFEIKNNILYKKDRRRKTRNQLLKVIQKHEIEPILYLLHNHPTGAHLGVDKVFEKARNKYYWPQMFENIKNYIRSCDRCQRRGKYRTPGPLHPIPVGEPFSKIGIDIVGPLPLTTKKNRYIVVATDYFTKWPEAEAISEATGKRVSEFIYQTIICRHGCPKQILSDRGTHFRNEIVDSLLKKFEIQHLLSTPYHPQTNGLVERFNRTLCESLAKLTEGQEDWDHHISPVLFAYRTAKQSSTKITPFYLVYGRNPQVPPVDMDEIINENILSRLFTLTEDLPQERETAKRNILKSQRKQKEYHDQKKKLAQTFKISDKVLMYDAARDKHFTGKLKPKWKGPYYIHDTLKNGAYKLRTMDGKVLAAPINIQLLKKYHDRETWEPQILLDNYQQ